jgi:MFS family permease
VNLAIFTDIFYYGLVVPVLPFALSAQVGIAEDQVQYWVSILLAAYSAALFVGSPIAGLYADHTSSRRWPLLIGLLALAGSTFLLAFGNSLGLFVLGRVLQGLSAAVVWSVGCALLVDTMGTSVGVAMGYASISMSIALLLAPVIGGVLYNNTSYLAVYYVAFGIVGVDVVLRLVMIEKKVAKQWIGDDSSQVGTQPPQHDIERPTSISSPSTEPLGDSTDRPSPQTPEVEGVGETSDRNAPENAASVDQRKNRRGPIIALLKSSRLLAALYGIAVESGIL